MRLNRNMLSMRSGSYNMQTSVFRSGEFFPEHCHDFHEFFLVADGVLEHTLNGKVSLLPAGSVQLILPGDTHIVACAKGSPEVRIYNCNVNSEEMLKVLYFSSAGYDFPLDDCVQTAKMAPDHHWRHLLDLARETCGMRDDGTPLKNSLLRLLTQEVVTVLMSRSFREKAAPPQWLAESVEEMKKKKQLRRRTSAPDFAFRADSGASLPFHEEILRNLAAGVCDLSASGRCGLPAAAYGTRGFHNCVRCRISQFVILPPLFSAEVWNDSPEISCAFPDHAALIRSREVRLPERLSGAGNVSRISSSVSEAIRRAS